MLPIGQQPEKPLQRAIEQGGVKQIGVEIFIDGRGVEKAMALCGPAISICVTVLKRRP